MSKTNRRNFLKVSAIGTTGLAFADAAVGHGKARTPAADVVTPQDGQLELTISGLCVLERRGDRVTVLMPRARPHRAVLVHPDRWVDAWGTLEFADLAPGKVTLTDAQPSCGQVPRGLLPLHAFHKGDRHQSVGQTTGLACRLALPEGEIVLPSQPDLQIVPGWDTTWKLLWDNTVKIETIALTHAVLFRRPITPGTLVVKAKRGTEVTLLTVSVAAGETIRLTLSNDTGEPARSGNTLRHAHHLKNVFRTPPPGQLRGVMLNTCRGDVASGQVRVVTASDPICPVAYYEEP